MKTLLFAAAALVIAAPAAAQTYVHGYTTSKGTYVAPHYRSAPDSSRLNNWSTKGNYNPYTGKSGTENPYSFGSSSRPSTSYSTYGSSNRYGSSSKSSFGSTTSDDSDSGD